MGCVIAVEDKTREKFGVDIKDLNTLSSQRIWVRCLKCGEEFSREYRRLYQMHSCRDNVKKIYDKPAIRLEAKILDPLGKLPTRSRTTDAGYDLHSIMDISVPPHGAANVSTGIAVSAPEGYYYTIDGRSGLAMRGIIPFRGIIDSTYCGPLMVALLNFSDVEYKVCVGDRIAQIILHEMVHHDIIEVAEFSEEYNIRGTKGFGSSGR